MSHTLLSNPALKESRQPLAPEFQDLLRATDAGRITFHRKEFLAEFDPLGEGSSQFVFEFTADARRELTVPWTLAVDRELILRHIALDKPEHEALRGGQLLLATLTRLDLIFGASLVDASLRDIMTKRLASVGPIRDLLAKSEPSTVDQRTDAFRECLFATTHVIDGYGNSLILELGYSNRDAYPILGGALYSMFDNRHLLSTRSAMLTE